MKTSKSVLKKRLEPIIEMDTFNAAIDSSRKRYFIFNKTEAT